MVNFALSVFFGMFFVIVLPPLVLWINGGKSHDGTPLWKQYIKDHYWIK